MTALVKITPESDAVLCKALFRAVDYLGVTQAELGQVIGLDRTSITRLKRKGQIGVDSKAGELASYLIRVFRDLYTLMGGDTKAMQHWLATPNRHLNGTPKDLILSAQGLIQVLTYLDAMRGKV